MISNFWHLILTHKSSKPEWFTKKYYIYLYSNRKYDFIDDLGILCPSVFDRIYFHHDIPLAQTVFLAKYQKCTFTNIHTIFL